jgi:hypothetical protein
MNAIIEKLQRLCYSADDSRPKVATPFATEFEGVRWAVATNGSCLAAVPLSAELRSDGPGWSAILRNEPEPTHFVRLSLIRRWAGPAEPINITCPDCNGVPPRITPAPGRYCKRCDTLGREIESVRYGRVFDGGFNRLFFARVLAVAPRGDAVVRIGHSGEHAPLIMRADGWLAMVMPMNGVGDAPQLEVHPIERAPRAVSP